MLNKIIRRINDLLRENKPVIVAIDGRCGSGKTTLAALLKEKTDCGVIHADDFFLRPEQRTAERLSEIGGNIDYERLSQVLETLRNEGTVTYRPYNCTTKSLDEPVTISDKNIVIVEGSYSCHPVLRGYYDLCIFLTVSPEKQLERIEKRNPALLENFKTRWIPMEERYFEKMGIAEKCGMLFET